MARDMSDEPQNTLVVAVSAWLAGLGSGAGEETPTDWIAVAGPLAVQSTRVVKAKPATVPAGSAGWVQLTKPGSPTVGVVQAHPAGWVMDRNWRPGKSVPTLAVQVAGTVSGPLLVTVTA